MKSCTGTEYSKGKLLEDRAGDSSWKANEDLQKAQHQRENSMHLCQRIVGGSFNKFD